MGQESGYDKNRLSTINGTDYVAVSHLELGNLVGSLMHVCELTGDKEQREALKSEIKLRCREWLNDQYALSGYKELEVSPKG